MDLGQHDDFTQVTSLRRICPAEEAKETNGLSFWCLKLAPVLFHSMLLSNFFFSSNLSTVADGHKSWAEKKLESSKKFLLPYFSRVWVQNCRLNLSLVLRTEAGNQTRRFGVRFHQLRFVLKLPRSIHHSKTEPYNLKNIFKENKLLNTYFEAGLSPF